MQSNQSTKVLKEYDRARYDSLCFLIMNRSDRR